MNRYLIICLFSFFIAGSVGFAKNQNVQILDEKAGSSERKSYKVTFESPKKAILTPGSIQTITSKDTNLTIEFQEMHKTGNFPVIKIQSLPFKLTSTEDSIKFTWKGVGYELKWLPEGKKVALLSSEPFAEKTFTTKTRKVNHQVIKKGLIVETKRRDGVLSSLEVTGIDRDEQGKVKSFSVLTYSDKTKESEYHNENHITAPELYQQYEKAVNGEVLFIFTTNPKGLVEVYYR
ncbi:MAG: hypothetical protein OEY59_00085 [Deltaproteobacteria bacterium]|nr:hypothetical protein [Deltaproteobacteria bacterium]